MNFTHNAPYNADALGFEHPSHTLPRQINKFIKQRHENHQLHAQHEDQQLHAQRCDGPGADSIKGVEVCIIANLGVVAALDVSFRVKVTVIATHLALTI